MANAHLLKAVCAAAVFAAAPALAQTNMPTGDTGAGGNPNTPTVHAAMPNDTSGAPARPMHRMAGAPHHHVGPMHAAKGDSSQNPTVDQLNDQSYQAAHQGQAFNASGAGGSAPAGSTVPADGSKM